jgi:tartrate/fumarate subfamily iron-sulfur-dependent hydro-lyase beta chain
MAEYHLKTPIPEEEIRRLRVGDILFVSGRVITARDEAHQRAVEHHEEGKEIPVKIEGNILYHCGPIVKKIDDRWIFISAGPTTSTRMEYIEPTFIKYFRPRIIVGKGGLKEDTLKALGDFGAVYTIFPGGLGAKAALAVKEVIGVEWIDLGTPEALWILEVENFGPLIVTMDTHGKSIHREIEREAKQKLDEIIKGL